MNREAPHLGAEILAISADNSDDYLRHVGQLWEAWTDVPSSHQWLHQSAESLEPQIAGADDEVSALILCQAILDDFHAYAFMQTIKVFDALTGVVDRLNAGRLVASAAAARTAMEATVAVGVMTYRIHKVVPQRGDDVRQSLNRMGEFSDQITKSIWGRREPGAAVESRNVLTLIKALLSASSDPSTNANLERIYARLCDVVHPSAPGHQVFWKVPVAAEADGPWLVEIGDRRQATTSTDELVVDLVWVLGWCSYRAISLWRMADDLVRTRETDLLRAGILPSRDHEGRSLR